MNPYCSRARRILLTAAASLLLTGCSGLESVFGPSDQDETSSNSTAPVVLPAPTPDPTPAPTPSPTTFQGTVAGGGDGGTLEVTIQAAVGVAASAATLNDLEVSGILRLASGSSGLSGTYDDTTRQVLLSGDGFTLDGTVSPDGSELAGSGLAPDGASGTFTTLNTALDPTNYCGTYSGGESGTWNVTTSTSGRVTGSFAGTGGAGIIGGTLTGTSVSVTYVGEERGTASGTVQGTSVSGTWRDTTGAAPRPSGTFTGNTTGCP